MEDRSEGTAILSRRRARSARVRFGPAIRARGLRGSSAGTR